MTCRRMCGFSAAAAMSLIPLLAMAQEPTPEADFGSRAQMQAEKLTPDELADLVAPIALYPDPLLSQALVASTYPLEVVEARQWLRRNESLKGEKLLDAARQQGWDASVQALVAFPDVLATMNQNIQWTAALGDTFLAQESDVMAAVQRMRRQAQASGRLASSPQQTVSTEAVDGQSAVEIVPADPQVIYVPQYDPVYVWGPPVWGTYPALAYPYEYGFAPGIDIGFCFGAWGSWAGWGGWGWSPNWFGGSVFVSGPFFDHYHYRGGHGGGWPGGRHPWHHDPGHRLGVPYPNGRLASRYQAVSMASRSAAARSERWRSRAGMTSPYGTRSVGPVSRFLPAPVGTRSSGDQWRSFRGGQRSPAPPRSYSLPTRRYRPAPRYSAPSRSYLAPTGRYQSAPRISHAPVGPGRSFGGGGSGHSFGGGSHGGGHRR